MSSALSEIHESKTGAPSNINIGDSYDSIKVPSAFKLQNVVEVTQCHSSNSNALEAVFVAANTISSIFKNKWDAYSSS